MSIKLIVSPNDFNAFTVEKPLNPREQNQKLIIDIGGGWFFVKMCKGTTTVEENKTK